LAATKTPSRGAKPDKLIRDMLMIALKREAKDADGKPSTKLALVVAKLVDKAIDGDVTAIREIADRVDGKPAQAVTGPDGGPIQIQPILNVTVEK